MFGGDFQINGTGNLAEFSALKGPMTTQTLRGMINAGAMHWRGDRSNGFFGQGAFDSDLSFRNFIVAFPGLVGRDGLLGVGDMQAFADFALQLTLPPNPVRNLDNSLTPAQANGRSFYVGQDFTAGGPSPDQTGVGGSTVTGRRADGAGGDFLGFEAGFTCEGCHRLDPSQGFFGADGQASFENEPQIIKIAHLRNLYQKVGMFGMPDVPFNNPLAQFPQGDQVRGFGFLHDGSTDTTFRFFHATVFNQTNFAGLGLTGFPSLTGDGVRRDMEQFMLAFDSDLAPVVGQQVSLTSTNAGVAGSRIDLLRTRAGTPFVSQILGAGVNECDLVVKGTVGGVEKGWLYEPGVGTFRPDNGGPNITDAALRALATVPGQELTYTCATPGAGLRAGIDRDGDGVLDGIDVCVDVPNASQIDTSADGVGDACDNCVAKSNADQADTDADAIGNVCDDQCIGTEITSLASLAPAQGAVGRWIDVSGTGFGPNAEVTVGGVAAAILILPDRLLVEIPAGLTNGPHSVVVSNPEGCQTQEAVTFQVKPASSCGLLGIEAFALLGVVGWTRRQARRQRS